MTEALIAACRAGTINENETLNLNEIRRLIEEENADIEVIFTFIGREATPFICAVLRNNIDMMNLLLELGANISGTNNLYNENALHMAVGNGLNTDNATMQFLLDRMPIEAINHQSNLFDQGWTPLDYCYPPHINGEVNEELVALIRQHGGKRKSELINPQEARRQISYFAGQGAPRLLKF